MTLPAVALAGAFAIISAKATGGYTLTHIPIGLTLLAVMGAHKHSDEMPVSLLRAHAAAWALAILVTVGILIELVLGYVKEDVLQYGPFALREGVELVVWALSFFAVYFKLRVDDYS